MKTQSKHPIRILMLILVVACIGTVSMLWWNDAISPYDPEDTKSKPFTIIKGESVRDIASRLSDEHVIKSPTAFFLIVKQLGIDNKLQAGEYELSRSMDSYTIARQLTHGVIDIRLTIPEGLRIEEIATKLAKEFDIPEREFLQLAREGYMFPDTYQVQKDATAGAIIRLLSDTFAKKVHPLLVERATETGLSAEETIILASLVEREGRNDADRPIIAGILLNRLKNDWPLQVDATIQYALGYQPNEKTWWKRMLTADDKEIQSPYNTYIHTGLPPYPIANPGLSAIRAVRNPKQTEFWYYIHDGEGRAHYAVTLEEHEQNIQKYLR